MRPFLLPLLLPSLLGITPLPAQDQVSLKNGDQFIGTVEELSEGLIKLRSPHSTEPLEIKSDQLSKLSFREAPPEDLPSHSHQLNLRNGDIIPGKVTGLDPTALQFKTWFAGNLTIPRSQIKSLFYGIAPQKLLYQGPTQADEWNQSENWEFREGALTSNSRSSIVRDLSLPESFILRFQLKWESSPNARVHFCTSVDTGPENTDGYYLNFTSRGVDLFRVLPSEKEDQPQQLLTLGSSSKRTSDFHNNQGTIELRINRASRMIHFYIDDQLQGSFLDPQPAPSGSKVIFESLSSVRRQVSISAIKLRQWDAVTQRLRFEPRQDEENDTLTTDDGDRYSGQILNRIDENDQATFSVKSPLLSQIIHIPEPRSSILYFRQGDLPENSTGTFRLSLVTGGQLNLSEIQLGKDQLTGTHPWLGKLTLDRRIVSEVSLQKKAPPEPEETTEATKPSKATKKLKVKIQAN